MNKAELLSRIYRGVEYCGQIYDYHTNKCTRIGKKYDCESCKISKEEEKSICKAWKRVTHLTKLYHICQIIELINAKFEDQEESKLPGWAELQGKPEIILPNAQMKLFR